GPIAVPCAPIIGAGSIRAIAVRLPAFPAPLLRLDLLLRLDELRRLATLECPVPGAAARLPLPPVPLVGLHLLRSLLHLRGLLLRSPALEAVPLRFASLILALILLRLALIALPGTLHVLGSVRVLGLLLHVPMPSAIIL